MRGLAIMEAIASYFLLSLGFVLQKKGIGWIGHRGAKDVLFRKSLAVWVVGFVLMNMAVLPNYLALKTLSAYVVNAISGLNIVFLVFLSKFILGEKILRSDYFYSVLMLIAIAALNLMDLGRPNHPDLDLFAAYAFALIPIALLLLFMGFSAIKTVSERFETGKTVFLAALGGSMSGYAVTVLKFLQLRNGPISSNYLSSPFFYGYFAVSILSVIVLQIAYKKGSMIVIGPVQYGMTVFYPVLASYLIFKLPVNLLQPVFFAVIIVSVVLMVVRHRPDR